MALHKQGVLGIIVALALGTGVTAGTYYLSSQGSVAIKVNGEVISQNEFNTIVDQQKKQYAGQIGMDFNSDMGKTMLASLRKQVMDMMIDMELVEQEAKKLNIAISDADVDEQIDRIIKEHFKGDRSKMEEAIKQEKMTFEQVKEDIKKQLTRQKIYENVTKSVNITEEDAKKHYSDNESFYTKPESMQAKHILIKTVPDSDKDAKTKNEAALKKATDLIKQLNSGGDFDKLAKENSEDTGSKDKGGDLGAFKKGDMVKPFEDAVVALENGEISKEPVKTNFGYHIIKKGKVLPAKTMPFEEVKTNITQQLQAEGKQNAWKTWIKSTRDSAKIEYGSDFVIPSIPPAPAQSQNQQDIKIEQPESEDGHNHE